MQGYFSDENPISVTLIKRESVTPPEGDSRSNVVKVIFSWDDERSNWFRRLENSTEPPRLVSRFRSVKKSFVCWSFLELPFFRTVMDKELRGLPLLDCNADLRTKIAVAAWEEALKSFEQHKVLNIYFHASFGHKCTFFGDIKECEFSTIPFPERRLSSVDGILERVSSAIDAEINNCPICLEDFSGDRVARRMPCSHVFHEDCILNWFRKSIRCPLCRFKMPTI